MAQLPGPPPKSDAIRRNARVGPVQLPAEGRKGDPPRWPLSEEMSREESQAWAELWAAPQAVMWERFGWTRMVARYCRMMVAAEAVDARAPLLAQVVALEDRLGLSPKAMRLMMWTIASDEVADKRAEQPAGGGVRGRIKAVG